MEPPAPRLRAELRARGLEVGEELARAAFSAEIAYYVEHHVEGRDAASLDALRGRCAEVLGAALGDPSVDVRAPMLASLRFSAFPDAVPALRQLRARGLRLVVASNWDCSLPSVLEGAGLGELTDGVVTSAEAGAAKPDRRVFDAALELAGCAPERAVHVGDSPTGDVAGAAAAGIRAILLRRPGVAAGEDAPAAGEPLPSAVIGSLAELPRIL